MANVGAAAAAAMEHEDPNLPTSPSSLSNFSSSSDLDTESTGSFFPDRSTSLGMLMGVSYPDVSTRRRDGARAPSAANVTVTTSGRGGRRATGKRSSGSRGRRWWQLCREEDMVRRTSLGDFLRVERRHTPSTVFYDSVVMEAHVAVRGTRLFDAGRVLPPPPPPQRAAKRPVLLAGICSGG